ncbi:MAG: putative quinol monooxygenase [Rubritalea sp.]|uniref:putative quinol monooxygenase n=1 Tax=Rubritalea sp. TaxID=2109375 RepID=UPI003242E43E
MSDLYVSASITAKPDSIELVKAELLKFISPTRVETGCIRYDLHQDREKPSHFVFYETWTSKDALDQHLASDHIQAGLSALESHLEGVVISLLNKLA